MPLKIIWQGLHVCVNTVCNRTGKMVVADLPIGHALLNSCKVNIASQEIFCPAEVLGWLGKPLLESLTSPSKEEISVIIEKYFESQNVVILNCIDHLYGHAVLKLFNIERHLRNNRNLGVIVIVQDFLRWMVPEGVTEIWSVQLPLSKAMKYYPSFDQKMQEECRRFSTVYVSKAFSHPTVNNITLFTNTQRHDDNIEKFRVTFIWRDDRPWITNSFVILAAKKIGAPNALLSLQNRKIITLFTKLRQKLPQAHFTIAGIGKETVFPGWIDDQRVTTVTEEIERRLCEVYAESRLVIGVHGSNMLLPSAHAGMTIDLMPKERWGNFAQDIVFQENDPRIGSFRYRFFPISTSVKILAHLIETQIREFDYFKKQMVH
ncbi:MAG: hypothetical protein WCX28_01550 [Bacteriovoracaceae bacterium]